MIRFDAEVLKIEAKKDGLDRLYKITMQTNQPIVLQLEKYIAENTIIVEVKE